ncbi:hypothetical protein GCM10009688_09740 [Arthrobacter gandavensis]|uniref:Uncharacterized protein n=1 Tax=Arthrobacter gandavensis TaxID=169960 RepID=A0ABN2NZW8_9MICC
MWRLDIERARPGSLELETAAEWSVAEAGVELPGMEFFLVGAEPAHRNHDTRLAPICTDIQ